MVYTYWFSGKRVMKENEMKNICRGYIQMNADKFHTKICVNLRKSAAKIKVR